MKELARTLEALHTFTNPKNALEQYVTPSDIAAEILWDYHMKYGFKQKTVNDLGCGPGILGIGALLLGAKKVYFVDEDQDVESILEENIQLIKENYELAGSHEFKKQDIAFYKTKSDTVIQNPPFGTSNKGKDILFLKQALKIANHIISFHKTSTKQYIKDFITNKGSTILNISDYKFTLKKTRKHHIKPRKHIRVTCFIIKS